MSQNEAPAFSIIIPVLNEEKTIHHLLSDLSKQTFSNFEVILVDGHSEDKTLAKAKPFQAKIKLQILNSDIRQVCYQRNLGASKASSEILLFMDSDNRLPIYFLQGLKYHLETDQSKIFSTWINTQTDDADPIVPTVINWYTEIQKNTSNPFVIESMFGIRTDLFRRLKGFDPKLPVSEGSDLLRRALEIGQTIDIFKDPRYTYSFRRLRKHGTLKSLTSSVQLELSKALGIQLPTNYQQKLYPMKGGKYFDDEETSFFNRLLEKLNLNDAKEKLILTVKKILFED